MFGFFKKTSWKIEGKAFVFFRQVFSQLPSDLNFIVDGLDKGLYKRFSVNHALKGNCYSIGFDPSLSDRAMRKGMDLKVKNIIIKQDGQVHTLNITVNDALWIGFEIERDILDFKNYQIDVSSFKIDRTKSVTDKGIKSLVSNLTCTQLDLTDLRELEFGDKTVYQIKDLEDGNYIAIDNKGEVFGLSHDPYEIQPINKSVRQFVEDVNGGLFDFEKYLTVQNGYA